MAVIREYKAACGATVRIDDACFWPEEEHARRKAEADQALCEIFERGYLSRQAKCARAYERRMRNAQIRSNHGRH